MSRFNVSRFDAFRVHLFRCGLDSFASSLIWTVMMLYQVQVAGLSPIELVLVGTSMEATVFLFEIPTGIVADVYSRRLSIVIGTALMPFSYLIIALFPVFAAIIIAQVVWGIAFTFISGAYEAWMVDEIGQENVGNAFIRGGQVSRITGIIGILAAVLLGSISLQLSLIVGTVLLFILALVSVFIMPETNFQRTPRGERSSWGQMADTFREGVRVLRGRPALMSIFAVGIFVGLYSEGWDRLWQIHLIENIGLPQIGGLQPIFWFGAIDIVSMVIAVFAAEIMRRRVDMKSGHSLARAFLLMIVLMIVGLLSFAFSSAFIPAMIAFFVYVTVRGLSNPLFDTWSNMHIDSKVRATVLSMRSQTDAVGQIVGGPPLGALGQVSLQAAFVGSAFILSPVVPLVLSLIRREAKTKTAPVLDDVTPQPIAVE